MLKHALNLSAIAALVISLGSPAYAQTPAGTSSQAGTHSTGTTLNPAWEASLGYQFLRSPDQTFPFGVNIDGARNFGAVGLVADLGWSPDKTDDVNTHMFNIGAGPRWTGRSEAKVWPFAQVVAGVVHARSSFDSLGVDISNNSTRFMLQPGAGAVILGGDGWGIVGQADYRRIFLKEDEDGATGQNDFRVFVGIRVILD